MGREILITDSGVYDRGAHGRLPDKEPGRHRWIAVASYVLTEGQARAVVVPGTRVNLDHENRMTVGVGCIDCEGEYEDVVKQPCPAGGWKPGDDIAVEPTS